MNSTEKRAASSLAFLYALRMLGLFMVLPVMVTYGEHYEGATIGLLGLAMGVYGLTQALLQIPAGTLSDRIGRKPIIIVGLIIFALGSLLAATADNIWMLLFGRALQGAGAIASAIMALLTDLTREQHRMKAMAMIGMSIGLSFSVALVLGPWLASLGGLSLIFGLTAVFALLGVLVVIFVIPNPPIHISRDITANWHDLPKQFLNAELWPLNTGIFLIHALMVAIFIVIPKSIGPLLEPYQLNASWLYLPILLTAFIFIVPFIIIAEKKKQMKTVVLAGALVIAISLIIMTLAQDLWHWIVAMLLYFWGFNLMEASLPSWLSKIAPAGAKGTAMGIYSSMQFMGAFVGGAVGGILYQSQGGVTLLIICTSLVLIWVLYLAFAKAPRYLTSVELEANHCSLMQLQKLEALSGVAEVSLDEHNNLYLKVDADLFDRQQALNIINN